MSAISLLDKHLLLEAVACDPARSRIEIGIVACILHCLDNNTGLARVGFERLSERTGASRSGVQRGVKNLERAGVLPVHRRGGSNKEGDRMANVYHPNLSYRPAHLQSTTGVNEVIGRIGSTDATSSADAFDQERRRVGLVASTLPFPSSLPGFNPGGEEEGVTPPPPGAVTAVGGAVDGGVTIKVQDHADRFDEFWSVCPKREKRQETIEVYREVLASGAATPCVLIAAMQRYAVAKAHLTDSKYLKFPHNWLRGECWLEDPQPPKAKPVKSRRSSTEKQTECVRKVAISEDKKQPIKKKPNNPEATRRRPPVNSQNSDQIVNASAPLKPKAHKRIHQPGNIMEHHTFGPVEVLDGWTEDGYVEVKVLKTNITRMVFHGYLGKIIRPSWAK
ncbi:hypothetical protein [Azospirillum palustre]|uniref:hypothetical protein n=1 Tax=Azospirillum palustre TaxID=2044885 RepID=UPI0011786CB9|nr:hypothetical protein [Azospirillum palustre]